MRGFLLYGHRQSADYCPPLQASWRSLWTAKSGGFVSKTLLFASPSFPGIQIQRRHESLEALMELLGETVPEPADTEDVAIEQPTMAEICSEKCGFLPKMYLQLLIAVAARLMIYPLITVGNYRRISKFQNAVPSLQAFYHDISESKRRENLELIKASEQRLHDYCKSRNLPSLGDQLIPIVISTTLFGTQFFGIMKAAKAFCVGFDSEGMLWFTDLTSNSPVLAIVASSTYCTWMLAVLCFVIPDFTLNAVFASLYSVSIYRKLMHIEDPIKFDKQHYIDFPEQVSDAISSRLGKIRAIRRRNLEGMRRSGLPLLFDPERLPSKLKEFIFRRKPVAT
ncbi:unnamed protein product [Soboliphyme baturini]|uniref:Uncharacterized protein n=1 Tax=Soboliphyme baturini TaxID=241478 RepID=A0A183J5B3_9BILA|nr:unnamed protein product [Soboliphyme baturini]